MMTSLVTDLAWILATASAVTLIFHRLRQPVVLGYIVAGMIVGALKRRGWSLSDESSLREWADLGVVFLMFSLGLDFSFRRLSRVGISATLTALLEVSAMFGLGTTAGRWLGWGGEESILLGGIVAISSTTIIAKAFEELGLQSRRFAEYVLALLVVEDVVAVVLLVVLSGLTQHGSFSSVQLLSTAGRVVFMVAVWILTGYFIVPRFVRWVSSQASEEILTLVSVALCLGLVVAAAGMGYSIALGAFIMGSIIAESGEGSRIRELVTPLRDLFSAVFFVSVGMLIPVSVLVLVWREIIGISLLVVIGKVIFVSGGALATGQTLRTSVQVGTSMAQVGEFSFLIAGLLRGAGRADTKLFAVAGGVSVLTSFLTPFWIRRSHSLAVALEKKLPLRCKQALSWYAAWSQVREVDSVHRARFHRDLFRWGSCAIAIGALFLGVQALLGSRLESAWELWLVSLTLAAPFVWGMLTSFREIRIGRGESARASVLASFLARILAVIWVGLWSARYLDLKSSVLVAVAPLALVFWLARRRLEQSFLWFEKGFREALRPRPVSQRSQGDLRKLAPWDAHLVRFKVHPNSEFAGQTLRDAQFRQRFGVTVVAIQRGLRAIVAPDSGERVFPKDELLFLGTDSEVDAIRPLLERPPGLRDRFRESPSYAMQSVIVRENGPLADRTIGDTHLREDFGALVVGIERDFERTLNPKSSFVVRAGDVLWLVGDAESLAKVRS